MKSINAHNQKPKHSHAYHVILLFIPILLFIVVLFVAAARLAPYLDSNLRMNEIKAVYASLDLDNSYIPQSTNIFGDRRPYTGDPTKFYASTVTFVRPTTVDDSVKDLTKRIEDAGFNYVEEAYPGSASRQYHFKSPNETYIRISVSSKPRDDAIENKFLMKQQLTADDLAMDTNAGPSDISIKVNLDGNND